MKESPPVAYSLPITSLKIAVAPGARKPVSGQRDRRLRHLENALRNRPRRSAYPITTGKTGNMRLKTPGRSTSPQTRRSTASYGASALTHTGCCRCKMLAKSWRFGLDTTTKSDRTARSGISPDHAGTLSRRDQPTRSGKGGKLQTRVVRGWVAVHLFSQL